MTQKAIGVIEVLLSGICFGFLGVFGKWAYQAGVTSGELLSLRFIFAASALGIGLVVFKSPLLKVSRKTLFWCAVLGAGGYATEASFYFKALQGLSASLTVLLLYCYPALVTLGALLVFGERLSLKSWLSLPLVTAGVLLLVWVDFSISNWVSFAFGIGSAVVYAGYILLSGKVLKGIPALSSALYIQAFTGLFLGLLNLHSLERVEQILQAAWIPVVGISLISTVAAMTLFLSGLQKLPKAETAILSAGEPVTAIILAALLLGESLRTVQLLGAGLVMTALILVATSKTLKNKKGKPPIYSCDLPS